jgi:hypothetical protein
MPVGRVVRFEPNPVIGYPHDDLIIETSDRYAACLGVSMLCDVSKRFLCDPVKTKLDVVSYVRPSIGNFKSYLSAGLPAYFRAAFSQSLWQFDMI